MLTPRYIHLEPTTSSFKNLEIISPFAAVVVIDAKVHSNWRKNVSDWLVEKGCLYMMAHGDECSLWDDSVDTANLEVYNGSKIPYHKFVTTTWHDNDSLEDVFYFAKECALPFSPHIKNIVIFDITEVSREQIILSRYEDANAEEIKDKTDYIKLYSTLGEKFVKASSGTLEERLAFIGPIFLVGVACLLLWAIIDSFWSFIGHFLS